MNAIISFVKGMLNPCEDRTPVGLCSFEHSTKSVKVKKVKQSPRKKEMRLSELMDR